MSRWYRVVWSFCIISRLRALVEHLLQFGGKISDRPGTRTQNLQLRKLTRCHYANPPHRLLLPQKPHGGLGYRDHGPKWFKNKGLYVEPRRSYIVYCAW